MALAGPLAGARTVAHETSPFIYLLEKHERLLDRLGVRTLRSDTTPLVPLSELEAKVEPFWESIQAMEMLRRPDR